MAPQNWVDPSRLRAIRNQKNIPVLERWQEGEVRVRLPFDNLNRSWLQQFGRRNPKWIKDQGYWLVPRSWFDDLVVGCLKKYGKLYIIQPYRGQERCARACQEAQGHECQCSCMGVNHGANNMDNSWFEVSDSFALRWGDVEVACRLLVRGEKAKQVF